MTASSLAKPLGFGLGLRPKHYDDLLNAYLGSVSWLEVLTENYLVPGGKPLHYLQRLHEHYPMVLHGVSLSIAGDAPLNCDYLQQVRVLAKHIDAHWISDHLCWTGVDGINMHDLMPVPFTGEALRHIAQRIRQTQDFFGQRILIENVSSYLSYRHNEMSEWEFLTALANEADCLLLLDINNIYVSSVNHGFDALEFLHGVPIDRVQQFHLAGHSKVGAHLIDTHDAPVSDAVWQLYAAAVQRFGNISTMIERDANIPALGELLDELDQARIIATNSNERAA
ncbi:MAG: DUF692 domain-containing protein [Candidatus Obscuribacterales bacterium]|nr:DUF692 domain-containing protein [Steroidobacteraceae bacterium]